MAGLGFQPLWWDEGWSLYFASLSPGQMLAATAVDIHPPLYYLLLRAWVLVFGFSPTSARSLSLVCGLVLVAGVYALGLRLGGRRLALAASLLAAISPLQAFYSQEARMYALLAGLSVLSWVALLSLGDARHGRRWAIVYVAVTAAALYTEYYAALLWAGQVVYVAIEAWRPMPREPWWRDSVRLRRLPLLAAPLLLYLPWLAYALPRLVAYVGSKQAIESYVALDPLTYLWSYLSTFATGHQLPGQPTTLWLAGVLAGAALALLGAAWGNRLQRRLALCLLLVPLVGGYVVNVLFPFTPPYFERVLLFAATPLYLLSAGALVRLLGHGRALSAAAVAVALLSAVGLPYLWTTTRYTDRDYRPVFAEIRRYGTAADAVLCVHPWQYGYALAYLPPRLRNLVLAPVEAWSDAATRREDLTTFLARYSRLWVPAHQSLGRILESDIAADLDAAGYRALSGWHGSETLLLAYAA
ncbi:MAG: glycosyltransferase family 39 protein, partial [Anaerolineae bacterium]